MGIQTILSLSLLLVGTGAAVAQDTVTNASLTGRVLDPTGAAIPGAAVTARSLATNQERTSRSDEQGRFHLFFLPPGRYQIATQPTGFSESSRVLQLSVGAAIDLTLEVAVGSTISTVEVAAQPPVLEANRSQVSATISETEVNGLPYSGRNYLDLALLAPGVSPTNTNSVQTFAETSPLIGQGYSINSQRNFSNSFIVDGLSANDDAAGLAGNSYGMDVVREFQVVTSGGQAEFGRALGGYFNVVTRSGTNDLHGTGYGFLRNQRLNANNALTRNRLPLTQGQYGASFSGPLRRDRSFLFGNYEGRRLNTAGVITIDPSAAATINARLNAIAYAGPRLAVSGPTTLYPTTVHTDNAFARLDHHWSDADQFTARYSFYQLESTNARGVGSLADVSYGTAVRDTSHTLAVSNIAMLSPRSFNETRGQFTYDDLLAPPNTENSPAIVISGVATMGRFSSSPTARRNLLYELVDNLLWTRSAHNFKAGVDLLVNDDTITFPQSLRGSYTFSSLANFVAGTYNTGGFTQSFGVPSIHQINPNLGFYVQDAWKLGSRLTVNAGLRYDLQFLRTIQTDANNISPRLGLAWSPGRSRSTLVRGSFGLFYERIPLRALANALLSANNTTDPVQAQLLSYTFSPSDFGAPIFPALASAPPAGARINYALMNRNIQNAYSLQMSLEVEQQISPGATLDLSYQRARGVHLLSAINRNINPDGARPDPTRGNIRPYDSLFDSTYDGLGVSFVERPVSWGMARVSYTWSKALNNIGEFFFSAPVNNFDLSVDRARSDDDQRQRVVFDASVNSSTAHALSALDHLTHGWRLGGILQFYSRLPFNIVTGQSTAQQTAQRPCAPGSGLTSLPAGAQNACTQARKGALIGRNAGVGFDLFNLNTRLSRTFALTDHVRLEGLAEAFNVLNHRNDMIPNGTWGTGAFPASPNPTFGQATAVGDARSVQLGARISF